MKFDYYGELEWLDPKDYYADAWKYCGTERGEDGELYDIVYMGGETCYTTI